MGISVQELVGRIERRYCNHNRLDLIVGHDTMTDASRDVNHATGFDRRPFTIQFHLAGSTDDVVHLGRVLVVVPLGSADAGDVERTGATVCGSYDACGVTTRTGNRDGFGPVSDECRHDCLWG